MKSARKTSVTFLCFRTNAKQKGTVGGKVQKKLKKKLKKKKKKTDGAIVNSDVPNAVDAFRRRQAEYDPRGDNLKAVRRGAQRSMEMKPIMNRALKAAGLGARSNGHGDNDSEDEW